MKIIIQFPEINCLNFSLPQEKISEAVDMIGRTGIPLLPVGPDPQTTPFPP
jgi:hypothetical protein